jgi:hypothetical protein
MCADNNDHIDVDDLSYCPVCGYAADCPACLDAASDYAGLVGCAVEMAREGRDDIPF